MTGDTERRKVRIKIERDAHPALLSFKGGATPLQVEERINSLFGLSYTDKYHLAGVADMHQILREHPEIRQRHDGKFEIIANNANQDLVALVSKQKDKVSSRSTSCIGYRHKYSPRAYSRLSPRSSRLKRPLTAMTKKHAHKAAPNLSQSFSTAHNHSYRNNAGNNSRNSMNPHRAGTVRDYPEHAHQRPLVRPKTATSIFSNLLPSSNGLPLIKKPQPIESAQSVTLSLPVPVSEQMPSIKQFSQNVKRMMMKVHPRTIMVSEMTRHYFQEYNVLIDPSKLYSKPWKMLLKTTFKDWIQVNGEEVTLKNNPIKQRFVEPANLNETIDMSFNIFQKSQCSFFDSFNEEKELNISVSQSISPSEDMIRQMQDLKIGSLNMKLTPEKPPGIFKKPSDSNLDPVLKFLVEGGRKKSSKNPLRSYGPFIQVQDFMVAENRIYDSKSLYKIKKSPSDEKLKIYVSAALNEIPCLKRGRTAAFNRSTRLQGYGRASPRKFPANKQRSPPKDLSALIFDISADSTYSNSPSSLSPPDSKPVRMRLDNKHVQITKNNKDVDSLYILPSENSGINFYKQQTNTCLSANTASYATESVSSISTGTIQNSSSSTTSRKLVLPPMSKGVLSKPQQRLPPSSCIPTTASSSNSSMCSKIRPTNDDSW